MEPITTAVEEITIDSNRIIHETEADLVTRNIPNVIRLVQYDMTLPVIAVSLSRAGVKYTLPSGAACNIRLKKPDGTVVYDPAYGCDSTRSVVYFVVTTQMTVVPGELNPVIEVIVSGKVAGSSPLRIKVEENPVLEDDIDSEDEIQTIIGFVAEAEEARDDARDSEENAEAWAVGTIDGTDVPSSADQYHNNAKYYALQSAGAPASAAAAALSAAESEAWAKGTIDGTDVPSTADQYHNNSKYYAEQAGASATSASSSAQAASDSEAWAVGTKNDSPVPSGADQYNNHSKFWAQQAQAAAALVEADKILGNFATYEETATASKAYKIGEYLTYNGYLYRVTTAISSGGTITVGTNVVKTDVGTEVMNKVLRFDSIVVSATTGDIATVTDSRITADHVLADCVWGDPSYITSDVTLTTSAGSMVLNGTCSTATTATITLVKKDN